MLREVVTVYVNSQTNIVYLATPRTASRTVGDVLRRRFLWSLAPAHIPHVCDLERHHARLVAKLPHPWRVVTVVRNHYDIVGSWAAQMQWDEPGPEFLDHLHGLPYYRNDAKSLHPHLEFATRLVSYEHVNDELPDALGLPTDAPFPVQGATHRPPWEEALPLATQHAIASRYGAEMASLRKLLWPNGFPYPPSA